MSIFGYDPLKFYDGRGSFESMGAGLDMKIGDIAFKSNFAFMNLETGVVERRRVDRTFAEWGVPLCDALNGIKIPGYPDHIVYCEHATEHRCGVVVSGPGLSSLITGTDPLKDDLPLIDCTPTEKDDPNAGSTAELVNALSREITRILLDHPICKQRRSEGLSYPNLVLLRGAGQRISVPTFQEKHGLKSFMVAPTAIIRGVGMTIGM
jgi:2,3-diphosphopglycerate-independent phosphoglycerate mutase